MGIDDSVESRIELEVLRERQKHLGYKIHRLEQELIHVCTSLGRKEKELKWLKEEREDLKVKFEVLKISNHYITLESEIS